MFTLLLSSKSFIIPILTHSFIQQKAAMVSPPIVVQTKPGDDVWAYENWWSYRLHNCCDDPKLCCAVWWCCPCLMHRIYKRTDEDMLSCCWPMTFPLLRTKIRTLFRIRGSLCVDCLATCCCPPCSIIQIHQELTEQGL